MGRWIAKPHVMNRDLTAYRLVVLTSCDRGKNAVIETHPLPRSGIDLLLIFFTQ